MHRARLLRSTPFRIAVIFSALFICGFVVSSFIAVQSVRVHLLGKLDKDIEATFSVLAASYTDDDVEDLVALVDGHVAIAHPDEQIFLLMDRSRTRLAGNISAVRAPNGLSTVTASDVGLPGDERYRVFIGAVGENQLVVGKSYADMDEVGETVATTFIWATLAVLAAAIAGGAILANRLQRRMDAIDGTMARVSEGDLAARIPLRGNGDDIDVLSGRINATLARLSGLFEGMRQVSTDIAHDLKTPLNRLKMTIQSALAKQEAGISAADQLAEADGECDRINATFDALLRIAQIEAGARKARFADVVLGETISTIADAYVDVAEDNGQVLSLDNSAPTAVVSGDQELLLQMCANLVENAITHCPRGARVELALRAEGEGFAIVVSDNGPGIPEGEREKVLRRLYRLEKSRTTPGSGLGLSLVKAIADLHGAALTLSDNRPGLCVTVRFPNMSKVSHGR